MTLPKKPWVKPEVRRLNSPCTLTTEWVDGHRDPQCKPNPDYPNGIDLDQAPEETAGICKVKFPYPAPRFPAAYTQEEVALARETAVLDEVERRILDTPDSDLQTREYVFKRKLEAELVTSLRASQQSEAS